MNLLQEAGTPEYLLRWLYSYLTNRFAYVGDEKYELTNGVPQGSVLGPVLFQIYIAPVLRELKNVYTAYYADDLCIACGGLSYPTIGAYLQRALNKVHESCCTLGVELDPRKTKVMWMRKSSTTVSYPKLYFHLGPKQLEYTKCYKYLGILLDNRLTFNSFVKSRIKGAKKRNGAVFKLPSVVKRKLRMFWRGYVEPYLLYGIPEIYHLISETSKNELRAFYARSARMIAGLLPHCPADIAVETAGLQPLDELITIRRMDKKVRKSIGKDALISSSHLTRGDAKLTSLIGDRDGFILTTGRSFITLISVMVYVDSVNTPMRQDSTLFLSATKSMKKQDKII